MTDTMIIVGDVDRRQLAKLKRELKAHGAKLPNILRIDADVYYDRDDNRVGDWEFLEAASVAYSRDASDAERTDARNALDELEREVLEHGISLTQRRYFERHFGCSLDRVGALVLAPQLASPSRLGYECFSGIPAYRVWPDWAESV